VTAPASNPFPSAVIGVGDQIVLRRERTRTWLAWAVIGLLALDIVLIMVWFFANHASKDGLQALLTGLFTPIVGLAGTVLGFYFGSGGDAPPNPPA
jgi:uncharacterized membrane protein (DUF4010 family)